MAYQQCYWKRHANPLLYHPNKPPVYKISWESINNFGVYSHSSAYREQRTENRRTNFLLLFLTRRGMKRTQKKFQRDRIKRNHWPYSIICPSGLRTYKNTLFNYPLRKKKWNFLKKCVQLKTSSNRKQLIQSSVFKMFQNDYENHWKPFRIRPQQAFKPELS